MKDKLIGTLQPLGYPVFLQGTMQSEQAYPGSFFTFWNNASDGGAFYDNNENAYVWDFDLNFYSIDPRLVNAVLIEAKGRLKAEGFICTGKGYDVASDEPTHTGRAIQVFYKER